MLKKRTTPSRRRSVTDRITLADVARIAGVSAQTVSRALRGTVDISEETRVIVLDAVKQSGYVPNLAARNLASNRSMLVAAIIPLISSSVFSDTMQGLHDVMDATGYQIFMGDTQYDPLREETLIRNFLGRRPDGFFIVGTQHTDAAVELLRKSKLPVVETWGWTDNPIDSLVGFSNRQAIRAMLEELKRKGYRRPIFAGVVRSGDNRALERLEGFNETAKALWPDTVPLIVAPDDAPLAMATGARMLTIIRQNHPAADVIVFTSDIFASGAILAASEHGIRIPEDIAVVGFGDYEIANQLHPALSTVAVHAEKLGTISGQLLLQRMRGEPLEQNRINLGFELKMRESC